jgi:hypothetical protein
LILKVGIFFFIVLHLLPVHVAGADGPDEMFSVPLADRENEKDVTALVAPPYGPQALLT